LSGEPLFPTLRAALRLLLELFLTSLLDFPDRVQDEAQPRRVALQPGRYIWRQRRAVRGVYCCKTIRRLAQRWLELRMPNPSQVTFIRLASRVRFLTRHSRSRISRLASSSAVVGMRDHSAVAPLPT